MIQLIIAASRNYLPYVTFPAALVIGAIGYNLEGYLWKSNTPSTQSVEKNRIERLISELDQQDPVNVKPLKSNKYEPEAVINRQLSPSLQQQ
uniref:Uncharacterized protein n=1 Tax=Tetranychus urticae TaxID=32264 RepID=T1JPT4_TETUR